MHKKSPKWLTHYSWKKKTKKESVRRVSRSLVEEKYFRSWNLVETNRRRPGLKQGQSTWLCSEFLECFRCRPPIFVSSTREMCTKRKGTRPSFPQPTFWINSVVIVLFLNSIYSYNMHSFSYSFFFFFQQCWKSTRNRSSWLVMKIFII